jgi:hypothetical protein
MSLVDVLSLEGDLLSRLDEGDKDCHSTHAVNGWRSSIENIQVEYSIVQYRLKWQQMSKVLQGESSDFLSPTTTLPQP